MESGFLTGAGPELDERIDALLEEGAIPLFQGVEPFKYLCETGKIQSFDLIRVRQYGAYINPHYVLLEDGTLENYADDGERSLPPSALLSPKAAPDGWEVPSLRRRTINS
jgi:hypothetical protein